MGGWAPLVSSVVALAVSLVSAGVTVFAARRQERELRARSRRTIARLRAEAMLQAGSASPGVGAAPGSGELLMLLLKADDLQVLKRTKQGVALDLAQLCSVTALPPSRVRDAIKRLTAMELLVGEHDDRDKGSEVRYRKQVADSVGGAAS